MVGEEIHANDLDATVLFPEFLASSTPLLPVVSTDISAASLGSVHAILINPTPVAPLHAILASSNPTLGSSTSLVLHFDTPAGGQVKEASVFQGIQEFVAHFAQLLAEETGVVLGAMAGGAMLMLLLILLTALAWYMSTRRETASPDLEDGVSRVKQGHPDIVPPEPAVPDEDPIDPIVAPAIPTSEVLPETPPNSPKVPTKPILFLPAKPKNLHPDLANPILVDILQAALKHGAIKVIPHAKEPADFPDKHGGNNAEQLHGAKQGVMPDASEEGTSGGV